ncbi:cytochrome c [Aquincola sp. MAHUQ-54]|uniref:Cytochrome c n=1 Tax=Aquincola agrisoli TaxID=3119538 RepID=A0AAW9QEU4_9BURK
MSAARRTPAPHVLRRTIRLALLACVSALATAALVAWLNVRGEAAIDDMQARPDRFSEQQVERGAYLARAGNCAGCHTAPGAPAYAGGKGIDTPFGTVYAGNLTPDAQTGLGSWTAAQFWRAMHHGRSKDGRLLYPAFPYASYTLITRDDSDALYAYLGSLPPVVRANRPHDLRFPYGLQASLAVWRALFFRPGQFVPDSQQTADWNRGAYLVKGLGHCMACHAPRNVFGATIDGDALDGGSLALQGWHAPSLAAASEAGVADWPLADIAGLLKSGTAPGGSTLGPMADVVFRSTQYLDDADLRAMAVFLKALPQQRRPPQPPAPADPGTLGLGERLYARHCAECHGAQGQGRGPYPALAGQRTVTQHAPDNLLQVILAGGFAPTTPANPRPYGMPPFRQALSDAEVAALATYLRRSWGHNASPVSELAVLRSR